MTALIAMRVEGAGTWMAVMACELLVLPLTKRLSDSVKAFEGVEHYDQNPPGISGQTLSPS